MSLPFGRRASQSGLTLRGGVSKGDSVKTGNSEDQDLQNRRKEFFVLRENALGGGDDDDDDDRKGVLDQEDSEDEVESASEIEDDSDSDSNTDTSPELDRSPDHEQLKDIWKTFVHPPLKIADLQSVLAAPSAVANHTEEAMYRQLLLQFMDPLAVGGKRVLWLDQETVLRLKGAAILALNPHLLPLNISSATTNDSANAKGILPAKGVRVTIAPAFPSYTSGGPSGPLPLEGTQTVQSALVKALCHSVGSARVSLTRENVNSVRQLAVEQGLSEPISDHHIILALWDALTEAGDKSQTPYTVVLQSEELSAGLSGDPFVARALTSVLQPDRVDDSTSSSRLFFMVLPEQAPLTVGQVPPSLHVPSSPASQQQEQQDGDSPMAQFGSFTPPPPGFIPPQFQSMEYPPQGQPIPMYTVVVQNGSARVIPSGPPHLLPPPPPPEVIQKLVNEAMKKVPEHRKGATFMGSLFAKVPPEEGKKLLDDAKSVLEDAKSETKRLRNLRDKLLKEKETLEKRQAELIKRLPRSFRARIKESLSNRTTQGTPASSKSSRAPDSKPNSESGDALIASSFEEVIVRPPSDHQLKVKWEKIVEEEMCRRIGKVNKNTLRSELRRSGLQIAPGAARGLREVLRRQVLSDEEVRSALKLAVKLQAGKYNVTAVLMQSGGSGGETGAEVTDGNSSASIEVTTAVPAVAASPNELVLSFWALDTALSLTVNAGAQPGSRRRHAVQLNRNPRSRSAEEINFIVSSLDKHEKALVSNVISPQEIGVTYDMIGGLEAVKEILRQSITYPLKYPKLYEEGVASEAVKGVLLFGPPGTGKTMLAKAVATEGGATFLTIDAATIENKWLGESEKNAKAVFSLARRLAPCVIYLDEVDSVLSSRESGDDSSHGTLTAVKTTLMQEWDGLRTTKDRVVVIASTNRPFDLDEAVLRRLPRRIMVDLPDLATRREILSVTLRDNRVAAEVNLTVLAEQLEGYTGSDIKEVCREAVVRVSHERAYKLEMGLGSSSEAAELDQLNAPLREVSAEDFKVAMSKLKASVSENGRELKKVLEWNEKFGEVKRSNKKKSLSPSQLRLTVLYDVKCGAFRDTFHIW